MLKIEATKLLRRCLIRLTTDGNNQSCESPLLRPSLQLARWLYGDNILTTCLFKTVSALHTSHVELRYHTLEQALCTACQDAFIYRLIVESLSVRLMENGLARHGLRSEARIRVLRARKVDIPMLQVNSPSRSSKRSGGMQLPGWSALASPAKLSEVGVAPQYLLTCAPGNVGCRFGCAGCYAAFDQ